MNRGLVRTAIITKWCVYHNYPTMRGGSLYQHGKVVHKSGANGQKGLKGYFRSAKVVLASKNGNNTFCHSRHRDRRC